MNTKLLRIAAIGLCTTAFGLLTATAKDSSMQSLRSLKGEQFDQAFLSHMIEHHRHGLEMAQMATSRAQSQELKQFAEKTATKQQEDIEKMESLQSGGSSSHHMSGSKEHGESHPGHAAGGSSHHDMQAMKNDMMAKLESAQGTEFDRTFADEMSKHHQMATEMAQLAQERAGNPQVKALAAKMLDEQKKEIGELKGLQRTLK